MQETHSKEALQSVTSKLLEILTQTYSDPEAEPVLNWRSKEDTVEEFGQLDPPGDGVGLEAALEDFRENILKYSTKTWHPLFLNQMFGGASLAASVSDLLASMMNPTLATWEMSPIATIIERATCGWMANFLGMAPDSSGIFLPGGSLSNLLALNVARNRTLGLDVADQGLKLDARTPVIICSESCHYSIANAGNMLGIGRNRVLKVKTGSKNQMLVDDLVKVLETCDQNDWTPIAIVATMGITVTGCYDPLEEIAAIAQKRNIHLHVDAAWGGGISLSDRGPEVFKAIRHADTVIWDTHKWLHTPLASTVLLTPHVDALKEAFCTNAAYLFHPQDEDLAMAEDLGHSTILCGKRFDALRVWILFKTFGESYFRNLANQAMSLTDAFAETISKDPDFELSYEPESAIVCFRYLPEHLRDHDPEWLDQCQRFVREQCKRDGKAFFNVAVFKGRVHCRTILVNVLTRIEHLRNLLDDIRGYGKQFSEQAALSTAKA